MQQNPSSRLTSSPQSPDPYRDARRRVLGATHEDKAEKHLLSFDHGPTDRARAILSRARRAAAEPAREVSTMAPAGELPTLRAWSWLPQARPSCKSMCMVWLYGLARSQLNRATSRAHLDANRKPRQQVRRARDGWCEKIRPRVARLGLVLGGRFGEPISHSANRLDVAANALQFLTQALDVRIDGARRDVGFDAPDVVE